MVSALVCGSSGPGSSPGRGRCVVFLGKTLYSHSASLHPAGQVYKWVPASCWGNLTKLRGSDLRWTRSRPGEVEILPATSCYRNRDKLRQLWARLGSKVSHYSGFPPSTTTNTPYSNLIWKWGPPVGQLCWYYHPHKIRLIIIIVGPLVVN